MQHQMPHAEWIQRKARKVRKATCTLAAGSIATSLNPIEPRRNLDISEIRKRGA